MIATRPDWCISRQRIWGVPIAVFLCDKCHAPLNVREVNQSIVALFRKEGADAWYTHEAGELLPEGTACAECGGRAFTKEMDILDVWFESGASWHAVLDADPELEWPADLYTEGGDQHRGWFHSSLLTSVAVRGGAPYRMVATSGWTLDEQGRAFSKSLGNGVDPVDIAKRLGGEIIRLWVASVDFREDVAASESLMARVSDNYRKLRNTLRFLLGNIHDFDPAMDAVPFARMEPLDQYILARMAVLDARIREAYEDFEFHRAYQALNEFTNTDLSALYLDVLKDRLYTLAPDAAARRSAQTALWRIAEALTRLIAPILSFTADEVWAQLPKVEGRAASVHLALFPDVAEIVPGSTRLIEADWEQLLTLRGEVLKVLEEERAAKAIGKASEARVTVGWLKQPGEDALNVFEKYRDVLPELFGTSQVEVSVDRLTRAVGDRDVYGRGAGNAQGPNGLAVGHGGGVAADGHGLADIRQRLGRLRGLLQRNQRRQRVVGVELLLDAGEFNELLGELVGIQRIEWVLVLQLRRQQLQEALKVAGDLLRSQRVGRRGR